MKRPFILFLAVFGSLTAVLSIYGCASCKPKKVPCSIDALAVKRWFCDDYFWLMEGSMENCR